MRTRQTITQILKGLDVVPDRDIIVHDERFYAKVLHQQSLGMGESYVDGWWDAPDITALCMKIIRGLPQVGKLLNGKLPFLVSHVANTLTRRHGRQQTRRDVRSHYDIGNELYEVMLDSHMVYSCAYFQDPLWTLEQAQEAKIDLVYSKLQIPQRRFIEQPLKVLDIGCGWGYGLLHGARYYGVEGVGLTLSQNQYDWASHLAKQLPVQVRLQDYRDIPEHEKFDAIFSIGMFEHVGRQHHQNLMRIVARHLKDDGLFLLHTIGTSKPGPLEPWMNKYIFPGAYLPSRTMISKATDKLFVLQDFHNFGLYYGRTLEEWYRRFQNGWDILHAMRPEVYTERFFRLWKYYLLTSAAGFYTGRNELWQFVFSRRPLDYVYQAVRNVRLQSDAKSSLSSRLTE